MACNVIISVTLIISGTMPSHVKVNTDAINGNDCAAITIEQTNEKNK
jgi:hypothetical protein